MATGRSFFHVHDRAHLVLFEGKPAERMAQHVLKSKHIVIPIASTLSECPLSSTNFFVPSSLIEIYNFHKMVGIISRRNADHQLVFSAGTNKKVQVRVVFLVGCHFIMSSSLDADSVHQIFQGLDGIFGQSKSGDTEILDGWKALQRAKSLAWLNFAEIFQRESENRDTIDLEELIHYSR